MARLLLCRLSVFVGGWTLDAAEDVCADGTLDRVAFLPTLIRLVDQSLVLAQEGGTTSRRYRLLETLREYADGLAGGMLVAAWEGGIGAG